MSEIIPGDYIIVTRSHYAAIRGDGRWVEKGEEYKVTSATPNYVRGTRRKWDSVVTLDRDAVRKVHRRIGTVPDGSIAADDPRVAWIFEDAARMADRLGLCADFDRLCDALGYPGRERTFTIKLADADGVVVTAKVQARSKSLARARLAEKFTPARQLQIEGGAA